MNEEKEYERKNPMYEWWKIMNEIKKKERKKCKWKLKHRKVQKHIWCNLFSIIFTKLHPTHFVQHNFIQHISSKWIVR